MVAPVVVRHLGQRVDLLRDFRVALIRHLQRRQDELAARALDVVQRAKARQHATAEQASELVDDLRFAHLQLGRDVGKRALAQRQVALQAVDQARGVEVDAGGQAQQVGGGVRAHKVSF